VLVEPEIAGEPGGEDRQGERLPVEHGVTRRNGLGKDAHDRAVSLAELVVHSAVVEHGPRLVSQREEDIVVDLGETAGPVGADDHAVEAISEVERDGHEPFDLLVGRRRVLRRLGRPVLADDLVLAEHFAREALRHRAVLRVVLEPLCHDEVQIAVTVVVLAREQQALLGIHELDRGLEHELEHAATVRRASMELLELATQLATPLALRLPCVMQAPQQDTLVGQLVLETTGVALEPLTLFGPLVP
jgi:hypothetical protein